MRSKTIRLFISSTFNDFKLERDALQDRVFPKLSELCAEHGFGFMPIDLRWGVSNEAQIDQRTMDLCLNEVKACKSEPHPDFVLLLGDRYGWVPLPYRIEQSEFEEIIKFVTIVDDLDLLNFWYKLDKNQIPASYILQQRKDHTQNSDVNDKFKKDFVTLNAPDDKEEKEFNAAWSQTESSLRTILQNAISQTDLDATTKEKYFTSATEFEFDDYLQGFIQNKSDSFLLVDRRIDAKNIQSSDFFDNNPKLDTFRTRVTSQVDAQNHIKLDTHLLDAKNISDEHIDAFASSLLEKLTLSITKEIQRVQGQEELSEIEYQTFYKNNTAQNIIAREDEITEIVEYTNSSSRQPYFLHGPSGMGKSSVMANAILQSEEELGANVVYRFCGVTKESSSTKSLLLSILKQLNIHIPSMDEKEAECSEILDTSEKKETQEKFENEVNDALYGISEKTIIYIDALDQLGDKSKCLWLPPTLPENLKIVISLLDDATYEEDSYYFQTLQTPFSKESFHRLEPLKGFDAPKEILRNILKEYNRTLQESQLQSVMELYKDVASPLYLHIIAQELRYYSHTQQTITLATTQKESIKEFIRNLTEYYHHSKLLVEKVFGYIFASQNSLSEATLYEILSNDSELVESVENKFHTNISKKLPTAVWARLHYQISPFLKEDEKGNLHFFHREFSDGAKEYATLECFSTLLGILKAMLQNPNYAQAKENLTHSYIESIAHQKYLYEDATLKKQIEFFLHQAQKDEKWVEDVLLYINDQGALLNRINQTKWAIAYQKSLLDICENLNNKNSKRWAKEYIIALINLGFSYKSIERTKEAIELGEKSLLITEKLYNENPHIWAEYHTTAINNLAISYSDTGKTVEAIELAEKAVSIMKNLYEQEPERWAEDYITTLNSMATCYYKAGDIKNSIEPFKEALSISERLYEQEPERRVEDYIIGLNNLASSYKGLEKIQEAIELEEKSLLIREGLYKKEPERWAGAYIAALNNLATSYYKVGDIKNSTELFEKALAISERLYKKEPERWVRNYTETLINLAVCYKPKAIALYEKVLLITEKFYKENMQSWEKNRITVLISLAASYHRIGNKEKAIELGEKTLTISERLYKQEPKRWIEEHTAALQNLGFFYVQTQKYEEAMKIGEKAISVFEELYSKNQNIWFEKYIAILYFFANLFIYNNPNPYLERLYDLLSSTQGINSVQAQRINNMMQNILKKNESGKIMKNSYDYTVILHIAKGLAINSGSMTVQPQNVFNALQFVELNPSANQIFSKIIGRDMAELNKLSEGESFIEIARSHPEVEYAEVLTPLIQQLDELFGNEKICEII